LANPPTHGPERKNADGTPVRGGILTAWDPATQTERWWAAGGGQTGGGTLSTASNLVIQSLNNGRLRAYTADKGQQLLDIAMPVTSGTGAPMTFMLDGKQYIAVLGGTGGGGRGGAGGRGGGRGAAPAPVGEITTAAANAQAAQAAPPVPAPPAAQAATPANNNPKLMVYAVQ
jgi:hypothetical protein